LPNEQQVQLSSEAESAAKTAAKKARYAELRKKMGRSLLEVKGKPGLHYFWADKLHDSGDVVYRQSIGYSIVREPKAAEVLAGKAEPEIQANGLMQDGTYQLGGELMLMCCSEELYEFLQMDVSERHEEMTKATVTTFESSAQDIGVPTFRVADKQKPGARA
jgi:hypothetical protein